MAEYNPFTKAAVNVPRLTNHTASILSAYITVVGIFPGRCLQVSAVPYVLTGNERVLTPSLAFSAPRAPVTCGCPTYSLAELMSVDTTGAPANVRVYQVNIHHIKTHSIFLYFSCTEFWQSVFPME